MFENEDESSLPKGWTKALACDSVTCVEVRFDDDYVFVRDSKDLQARPDSAFPFLQAPIDRWLLFLAEVTDQSPAGGNGWLLFSETECGDTVLRTAGSSTALTYNEEEWRAFTSGVRNGEFGPLPQLA